MAVEIKGARKRRGVNAKNHRYHPNQKMEAVQTYLMLGNLTTTAQVLGITRATIAMWKSKEWWKELEQELRLQEDLQLSSRLQKMISKSYDLIEDRLEHGDFIYDSKKGELVRKPVSMKDTHLVVKDIRETRENLLDRHLQEKTVSEDKVQKTLENLAAQFADFAKQANKPTVQVTDVVLGSIEETIDATDQQEDGRT